MWDEFFQIITNIGIQQLFGKHPLSRIVHNALIVQMLLEIHSGFDFPWHFNRLIPFGRILCVSPAIHNAHHRRGDVYFQQFFTYLDWFMGFQLSKKDFESL